jgi:hypothetical protein
MESLTSVALVVSALLIGLGLIGWGSYGAIKTWREDAEIKRNKGS